MSVILASFIVVIGIIIVRGMFVESWLDKLNYDEIMYRYKHGILNNNNPFRVDKISKFIYFEFWAPFSNYLKELPTLDEYYKK